MQHRGAQVPEGGQPIERPGWIFEIDDRDADGLTTAEIVEVLHVPGYRAYRVRWQDGSESTLIPSRGHRGHPPTVVRR